jgi:hypothetical protein
VINSRNIRRKGHPVCMEKKRNSKYFLWETEGIWEIRAGVADRKIVKLIGKNWRLMCVERI